MVKNLDSSEIVETALKQQPVFDSFFNIPEPELSVTPETVPPAEAVLEEPPAVKITPSELKAHMDKYVIGQEEAKRSLAVHLTNHLCILENNLNPASELKLEKVNITLTGPSGSGKTYLVKTVCEQLGLPFMVVDATEFSANGYKGKDVYQILMDLWTTTNDLYTAQKAVVFIDEFDKIAATSTGENAQFDRGVQYNLLKMIEGHKYVVDNRGYEFDTSNLLFVFSGAFDKLFREPTVNKTIGFSRELETIEPPKTKVTAQDMLKAGLIREFVGRLGNIITLEKLTKEQMLDILTKTENNIIKQYQKIFKLRNIPYEITNTDVEIIAEQAYNKDCGARALKDIASDYFSDKMYV